MCMFHTGVMPRYWNTATTVLKQWWPVWQMAVMHDRVFNDLDAADEVIACINAMPVVVKAGLHFESEKAALARGSRGGDLPLLSLSGIIQSEIRKAVQQREAERQTNQHPNDEPDAQASMAERVKSLCARIRNGLNLVEYTKKRHESRSASFEEEGPI